MPSLSVMRQFLRLFVSPTLTLIFLIGVLLLGGCASVASQSATGPGAPSREPPSEYAIGPEDVLKISVWKEEELTQEVLVRPDGKISFPLAGDVQAAGRAPEQIQKDITQRLQRYIPDPAVTVTMVRVGGNKIYVIGEVKNPGAYVIGRYVDVVQALAEAGGLTSFAKENQIKIFRREGGKEIVLPFEYAAVKRGDKLEQNVILRGGDTVVVP
jgi:Periplasmic protein involved in polysaccharide export